MLSSFVLIHNLLQALRVVLSSFKIPPFYFTHFLCRSFILLLLINYMMLSLGYQAYLLEVKAFTTVMKPIPVCVFLVGLDISLAHMHSTDIYLLKFRNLEIQLPLVAQNWMWFYLKLRRWKIGRRDAWIILELLSEMKIRYFLPYRRSSFWRIFSLWPICILSLLRTLHYIFQIEQTLDRSLYIYGNLQNQKEPNLCNCCFVDSEDQEYLTCSTCMHW